MEKAFSLLVFIIFFIMLASVENKVKAKTCMERLDHGLCERCTERCKAKHGPKGEGSCDIKAQLCYCFYPCPTGPQCYGGAGLCGPCGSPCCNQQCADKYNQGTGFCDNIGHSNLCKCEYPCK
ncbi:hypothetical protein CARUB_v10007237mg [Capsella rubella]|uniref:Defensin-like protein n=1 Tax=Capsella rubella TaxID=81985 RepID=R0FAB9_9BRAS|nr:defensin-like protein 183 [Capsella rubella]EOA18661.1 hypothetical protein CARUB_v10007237mg [Capsella rubella]